MTLGLAPIAFPFCLIGAGLARLSHPETHSWGYQQLVYAIGALGVLAGILGRDYGYKIHGAYEWRIKKSEMPLRLATWEDVVDNFCGRGTWKRLIIALRIFLLVGGLGILVFEIPKIPTPFFSQEYTRVFQPTIYHVLVVDEGIRPFSAGYFAACMLGGFIYVVVCTLLWSGTRTVNVMGWGLSALCFVGWVTAIMGYHMMGDQHDWFLPYHITLVKGVACLIPVLALGIIVWAFRKKIG